jgi:hypothetical protein
VSRFANEDQLPLPRRDAPPRQWRNKRVMALLVTLIRSDGECHSGNRVRCSPRNNLARQAVFTVVLECVALLS